MNHQTSVRPSRASRAGRRALAPFALAALFLAGAPAAAVAETSDCVPVELRLIFDSQSTNVQTVGEQGELTFSPGEQITIDELSALYGPPPNGAINGAECSVPEDHRFVIDAEGPEGVGTSREAVAVELFGSAGLAGILGVDAQDVTVDENGEVTVPADTEPRNQLRRRSVPDNVVEEDADAGTQRFVSLSNLVLTGQEDASLGDYTLTFHLIDGSGTTSGTTLFSLVLEFTVVAASPEPAAAPEPAPAAAAPVEQPAGGAQFVDASGTPIDPTIAVADGALTVSAGEFDTTVAGDGGATAASGPVTSESGSFTTTIEGDVPEGSVVEVWMFSEPRLVAAGLSDGGGTLSIDVPTGAPLDGGDPIPAGTHTMQLLIPTDSGLVAMNVGVTIGGPVPTVVPAGEGPAPIGTLVLAALLAVGGTALVGRRTLVAPTA